jgi:hypothetical protein
MALGLGAFHLGALGNVKGTKALQEMAKALYRVGKAVELVGASARSDPATAIEAEARAKAELAKAEGFAHAARAAGVFVIPELEAGLARARAEVAALAPVVSQAVEVAQDMAVREGGELWEEGEREVAYAPHEVHLPGPHYPFQPPPPVGGSGRIFDPWLQEGWEPPLDGLSGRGRRRRRRARC